MAGSCIKNPPLKEQVGLQGTPSLVVMEQDNPEAHQNGV